MGKQLKGVLTQTADRKPMVIEENFPGLYSHLPPADLRLIFSLWAFTSPRVGECKIFMEMGSDKEEG